MLSGTSGAASFGIGSLLCPFANERPSRKSARSTRVNVAICFCMQTYCSSSSRICCRNSFSSQKKRRSCERVSPDDCESSKPASRLRQQYAIDHVDHAIGLHDVRNRDRRRAALLVFQFDLAAGHHSLQLRSEEHTSELQSHHDLVCRLLLEK